MYHLSVYNSALTIDDIQKLVTEFQTNFTNPTELTTTRYCRDYIDRNGYCNLGDDKDFRYLSTYQYDSPLNDAD